MHHIIEQANGGSNEAYNKVACCSNCHSRIHNEIITIDKWYNVGFAMKLKWKHKGKEYFGQNTLPLFT